MRSFGRCTFGAAWLACAASSAVAAQEPAPAGTLKPAAVEPAPSAIRSVRREVLPNGVRVIVALDREVPFYQDRIESPPRLYFDLKGARPIPKLLDAVFRYDSDIVREIRFGRHANHTTRVVLDIEGVSRYSVYTLYEPYRIVIDCERSAPRPATLPTGELQPRVLSAMPSSAPVVAAAPPPLPPVGPVQPEKPAHARQIDTSVAPAAAAANTSGNFSVARQLGLGVSRIVIDAGHGGRDPGAMAFGISESDLVLDVALRLEKLLHDKPGFDVVLTRRADEYVPLEERTAIANREAADLFLSIHANASANAAARGVETYFLNFALNRRAEAVAARENAASAKTMSSLPGIVKAITLNTKVSESHDFAALVQKQMVRGLRSATSTTRDLGVKQAPFMVLIGASMPSVLAEISFVTNRTEARLLKTSAYRQKIAESLLAGILRYQQSLKKVETASLQ